ncbi:MAG: hypothetical protein ABIF04_05815 [Chloroflexota bacterium]
MADVRCQMCGKLNPPELEECKFCGARIKPVIASTPIDSGPVEPREQPSAKGAPESKNEKVEPAAEDLFRSAANEDWVESSADESSSSIPVDRPDPNPVDDLLDRLSDSGEVAPESDETPDWMAGLRGGESSELAPESDVEESTAQLGNEDWIARLGDESEAEKPKSSVDGEPVSETAPESDSGVQEPPSVPQGGDLPEWLYALPSTPGESEAEKLIPVEELPDQQNQPEIKAAEPEPVPPIASAESVSDWLSNLEPESETSEESPSDEPPVESSPSGELSDWRSLLGADVDAKAPETVDEPKDELDTTPASATNIGGTESHSEWLGGLDSSGPPFSGKPALIEDDSLPDGTGETSSFATVPDWLSGLSPEQEEEKNIKQEEGQAVPGGLEAAELPSWVQAMRPVESVVAEAITSAQDDDRVTELTGPLAGLRGVLPAGPGIGPLRKPPAYPVDLQISDGQQRYAASLDRLVAGETKPREVGVARPTSNRLLRWLIALVLILSVGMSLSNGTQIIPGILQSSSDQGAASRLLDGLSENIPVLVAFDYDPALFGELEATAAPFIDVLMRKGTPLTFISTSPTGPALAERFMQTMPLVESDQYRNGDQYVNLGYLAGGPAGMLLFAGSPIVAAPSTVDGNPAWETSILQDVQSLSDFAAFIILTDNSDTARNWIEQAGPRLGNSPMVMIISTQAEPIIRPYFDSGQLKGLISGLTDANIAEQNDNRLGLAHLYWNSFSVGALVIAVLIVVGAVWNAMPDSRDRRSNSGDEA